MKSTNPKRTLRRARTVLNVEDSDDDSLLLRIACRSAKVAFSFQVVEDTDKAIAYLKGEGAYADRAQYPFPDLVLLDLKLPIKPGFEVLAWTRAQPRFQRLPILVFTASLNEGDMVQARQLGADDYLVKAGGLTGLQELVRAIDLGLAEDPPSLVPVKRFSAEKTLEPMGSTEP